MKIIVIFGTRPEAIKLAPVILELRKRKVKTIVVSTGQHKEMLYQVLNLFKISPHYELKIMKENQSLEEITSAILKKFSKILKKEKPDLVLVQGDTMSAFASALTSYFFKIPIAHVEAGLRTYNKYAPFPEEIARRLIDHISDIHFAPTYIAKKNLLREGIDKNKIFVTGNTVVDSLFYILKKNKNIKVNKDSKLLLVTVHRRENWGSPLINVCNAILEIVRKEKDVEIIFPVHKNPKVRKIVYQILSNIPQIHLTEPLDYSEFVHMMKQSYFILTDSGGIQEEAPYLGKPVLVLRNVSERKEAVIAGNCKIVGFDKDKIVKEASKLIHSKRIYEKMSKVSKPFGHGDSSSKIVSIIKKYCDNNHMARSSS